MIWKIVRLVHHIPSSLSPWLDGWLKILQKHNDWHQKKQTSFKKNCFSSQLVITCDLHFLPKSWKWKMAPFNGIDTFQILRHFPLNHDLWEKRTHQFSNENLQKLHLQLLEVILFASFHLLPHNVQFGTTRSPHPLTWGSCWVSRWRNPHGVKLLLVSGKGKIQIIFVGSFWEAKKL